MDDKSMTLGEVAAIYHVPIWKVRRLFERNLLPPAARLGPYRVVQQSELPRVEAALVGAGYLPADSNLQSPE